MQTIVARPLADPPTADLINTARACVDQMTEDIVGLQDTYTLLALGS